MIHDYFSVPWHHKKSAVSKDTITFIIQNINLKLEGFANIKSILNGKLNLCFISFVLVHLT